MNDQIPFLRVSVDQFLREEASSQKAKMVARKLAKAYGTILDHFKDIIFILDEGETLFS